MSVKTERQSVILEIISDRRITSQEDLLQNLRNRGWNVTQATLSRDLKELGIVKAHDHLRGYIYRVSDSVADTVSSVNGGKIAHGGVKALEFSGNLAVIRTVPGFAGAIASVLDSNTIPEIAGSVAGDDTVILVIREGSSRQQVVDTLSDHIEGIRRKLQ